MSVDFTDFSRKMDRTLEHLGEDFDAVRAGRANAKVLDRISWTASSAAPARCACPEPTR